jgi:glutamine phosphoribosylpyrophosphate amidotransferase
MCGLIGYATTTRLDVEKVLESMYKAGETNQDSYGIYMEFIDGSQPVLYRALGAIAFINDTYGERINQDIARARLLLCHTRNASIGAITHDNTQPFYNKGTVFAHNGHVNGLGDEKKSDSRCIFEKFIKDGPKGIKKDLETGWGNFFVYSAQSQELILSPDPLVPRLFIASDRERVCFASESTWLNQTGLVAQKVGTTLEVNTVSLKRRRIPDWRPAKKFEYFQPRRYYYQDEFSCGDSVLDNRRGNQGDHYVDEYGQVHSDFWSWYNKKER